MPVIIQSPQDKVQRGHWPGQWKERGHSHGNMMNGGEGESKKQVPMTEGVQQEKMTKPIKTKWDWVDTDREETSLPPRP